MSTARAPAGAAAKSPASPEPLRSDRRSRARLRSLVADPRVEPGNRHIDRDVQHDEHDGIEEDQVLHDEDIALADRGEHRIAETLRAERPLDGDRAGKDKAEQDA